MLVQSLSKGLRLSVLRIKKDIYGECQELEVLEK